MTQAREVKRERKIASRLGQAVPLIISGAVDDDANGAYDPIYELHDEWPIYRKRDSKAEIVLLYVADKMSWIVKTLFVGQNHDEVSLFDSPGNTSSSDWRGKCLIILQTGIQTFPELRMEGCNGISEPGVKKRYGSLICVIPESEWIGNLEIEKLRSINSPSRLRDSS